jgi:hypothetical protein
MQQNINKALGTTKQIASTGVNKEGFDKLISSRFNNQIVRPQLEYELTISTFNLRNIREMENCQTNACGKSSVTDLIALQPGHALHNQPSKNQRPHCYPPSTIHIQIP